MEKEKYQKEYEHTDRRPLIFEHSWHFYDKRKKVDAINYYESNIAELMQELKLTNPV